MESKTQTPYKSFTSTSIEELNNIKPTDTDTEPESDISFDKEEEERPKISLYHRNCNGTMFEILSVYNRGLPENLMPPDSNQPLWTRLDSNPSDYFNFGFDCETWKLYINKQLLMRFERHLIEKHMREKADYERRLVRPDYGVVPVSQPIYLRH